jgi:malignant T-cell-amplified sequence
MFKRFSVAEDISTQTALKSSVQRAIKKSIVEQYPLIEPHIDDVIPKKAEVLEAKGSVQCKVRYLPLAQF